MATDGDGNGDGDDTDTGGQDGVRTVADHGGDGRKGLGVFSAPEGAWGMEQ